MRRVLGIAAACCALVAPTAARATEGPVATLTAETPVSAGHGWLLWSVPGKGGWSLEALHNGQIQTLPITTRPRPFDAQVGTDAAGAPVVTFSRCRVTPEVEDVGLYVKGTGALVAPDTGSGCRIHVLELNTGRETTAAIPEPRGVSDTTPAMWRGTLAFARKAPGHGATSQVMLAPARHPGRLVSLQHGAVPGGCPNRPGCKEFPPGGEVQALSIDAQLVAFVWAPHGPTVGLHAVWEERVDSLATGQGQLAGTPITTESCTAPGTELAVEEEWPSPPILSGSAALFPELERGGCYTLFGSALLEYRAGTRLIGRSSSPVVELARDGATTYGLIAQKPLTQQDPGCSKALPCSLQPVTLPPLKPSKYRPTPFN